MAETIQNSSSDLITVDEMLRGSKEKFSSIINGSAYSLSMLKEMEERTHKSVQDAIKKLQQIIVAFERTQKELTTFLSSTSLSISHFTEKYRQYEDIINKIHQNPKESHTFFKDLVPLYKELKKEKDLLDYNPKSIVENTLQQIGSTIENLDADLKLKLNKSLTSRGINFEKLRYDQHFPLEGCHGILPRAVAYIEKYDLLAIGFDGGGKGSLALVDAQTLKTVDYGKYVHKGLIRDVSWIEKKNWVITGGKDGIVRIFYLNPKEKKLRRLQKLKSNTRMVFHVNYIPKKNWLIVGGEEDTIKIWNLGTPKAPRVIGMIPCPKPDCDSGGAVYICL